MTGKIFRFAALIAAAMLHSACAAALLLYVLYVSVVKIKNPFAGILLPTVVAACTVLLYILRWQPIWGTVDRALDYIRSGTAGYSDSREYLISALIVATLVFVVFSSVGRRCGEESTVYGALLLIVCVVFFFVYEIFTRFAFLAQLFTLPTLSFVMSERRGMQPVIKTGTRRRQLSLDLSGIISIVSAVILLIACCFGNLSGYKFMIIPQ